LRAANGTDAFDSWLSDNLYTEAEFREALAMEMLQERMATAVTADVPEAVEQVRARYIQVDNEALAQSLRDQIEAGSDFAFLAQQHSQDLITAPNGGDLGYFAPGSLLVPQVESTAFTLQPGETSDVISVANPDNGGTIYYLVQLIERDPNRPLTAQLRTKLLQETFSTWLREQWDKAIITRLVSENP
jgi:parvulin-like peptidyl-prolyl isomerase